MNNMYFWWYTIPLCMLTTALCMMNLMFMNFALIDASKRNMMMLRLSQALNLNFHQKDPITIRLPVINIIDPKSVMTWLEIRKIVVNTGSRFVIRIEIYTAVFTAVTVFLDFILFCTLSYIIPVETFHPISWIYIICYAVVLSNILLGIMFPLSNINEQTNKQITMLI